MIHLHATKKILNTGKLVGSLHVIKEDQQQYLQNWYVTLTGSGFAGKFIVAYVHQPSLLTVFVKGKTIKSTYSEFENRLHALLKRVQFPATVIAYEMNQTGEYEISKTSDASMLAHMNQILLNAAWWCNRFQSYELIDLDWMENLMLEYLFKRKADKDYNYPLKYWEEKLGCTLLRF